MGHEILTIDITPEDIRLLGLYVVRAYIPTLIPMFVGKYNSHYLKRFKMNILNKKNCFHKWPHPMP